MKGSRGRSPFLHRVANPPSPLCGICSPLRTWRITLRAHPQALVSLTERLRSSAPPNTNRPTSTGDNEAKLCRFRRTPAVMCGLAFRRGARSEVPLRVSNPAAARSVNPLPVGHQLDDDPNLEETSTCDLRRVASCWGTHKVICRTDTLVSPNGSVEGRLSCRDTLPRQRSRFP